MYLFTVNTFPVSRCGTLCSLDGESHLFHEDGAVSKPVQFSEAAGSVQKRIISLLWVNSLESPKVSQCICYSYLATTAFDCHMWYLSEHLIASAMHSSMRKYRMKKGWWLLHFGRMLGPKILLNIYIPPRSLTVFITSSILHHSSF